MTQTTAAGLAGARTRTGLGRVRWEQAARLLTAWAATLPTAALVAAAVALAVEGSPVKRFVRTLLRDLSGRSQQLFSALLVEQLDATIEAARLVHEVVRGELSVPAAREAMTRVEHARATASEPSSSQSSPAPSPPRSTGRTSSASRARWTTSWTT